MNCTSGNHKGAIKLSASHCPFLLSPFSINVVTEAVGPLFGLLCKIGKLQYARKSRSYLHFLLFSSTRNLYINRAILSQNFPGSYILLHKHRLLRFFGFVRLKK